MADALQRISRFSVDLHYPGRTAVFNSGTRKVLLPAPPVWRFEITFAEADDGANQALYDSLKAGRSISIATDHGGLNLERVTDTHIVASQTLGDDYLELEISEPDTVNLGAFAEYGRKLVRVDQVGISSVRIIPRPDVLPRSLSALTPTGPVTLWMPTLSTPAARIGHRRSELTVTLQTLP